MVNTELRAVRRRSFRCSLVQPIRHRGKFRNCMLQQTWGKPVGDEGAH
jgi:hypothetical protein